MRLGRRLREILAGPGSAAPPSKEDRWKGYYDYYFSEARRHGTRPVAVLDEQWADGQDTAQRVLSYVSSASIVLEIACGIGRVSRFVAPRCGRLYCTDILDEALREAKETLKGNHNVSFHKTNGYDLAEFGGGTIDCVYSFTAFFHFDFELVVLYFREVERVLRPGGTGIIEFKRWSEPQDVTELLEKIESQGGIRQYEAMLDKWRYVSAGMVRRLCEHYGLDVIDDDVRRFTFRKNASLNAVRRAVGLGPL
jgi:ubiquinone/menaquinone biosynthesis C-methylase UbiE